MGTVPSPNIVESVALGQQAQQNAFGEYQRAAALQQQTAFVRQQQQGMALENQQKQQQIADQKALTAAWATYDPSKNSPNDPTGMQQIQGLILKNGGSGTAAQQAQQHFLTLKDTASQIAQRDAATGEKNLANLKTKNDRALGLIDAASDPSIPDEQLVPHLTQALQEAQQEGDLDPEHLQAGQQLLTQDPATIRKNLAAFKNSLEAHSQIFTEAQDKAKTEQANWKTFPELGVMVNTQTGEQRSVTGGTAATPGMMEAKYVQLAQKKAAGQPLEHDDAAWMKGYEKYKTLVPVANFNLQAAGVQTPLPPKADAAGQPLSYNQQIAAVGRLGPTVRAVLEGRQSPPGGFALKTPYWQNIMNNVYSIDPDWSEQRAELRKDFAVGKTAPQINAINTAMGHIGVLGNAIDALHNNDLQGLNKIANFLGVQTGATPVTTFNTIVHRVGPELAAAYIQGGGGEGERGTTASDFDPKLGPDQLKANVGVTAQLLRSKISSLENQWNQNKGPTMPDFQGRFIMPEAQRQLNRWSPQGAGGGNQGTGGATGAGGGKTLSMSAIQKAAKDHGVSVDEAKRQAMAAGYTIQ